MDITPRFKACVKMLKTTNKSLGLNISCQSLAFPKKPKNEFNNNAKQILASITRMKHLLEENKKAYINAGFLAGDPESMTDSERDYIDTEAQNFIQACVGLLAQLSKEGLDSAHSSQLRQHNDAIVEILRRYLKMGVCEVYSQQRAIRVKRIHDRQQLSRLSMPSPSSPRTPTPTEVRPQWDPVLAEEEEEKKVVELEFSPEEVQMFEEENERLYEELNSLSDVVKRVEGQVIEIVKLQEIFTEKVLEQDQDINRIQDTIINSTENIREGNEEIREAMKKNAGFRVWVLFFLIVLSFTLLFLDWYNP